MIASCPCGARWSGKAEHCVAPGCHQTFSGTTAGDLHRTGDHAVHVGPTRRRCRTADEMKEKGLEPRDNGYGTPIWGKRMAPDYLKSLSPDAQDGLRDYEWREVPLLIFSALRETESA